MGPGLWNKFLAEKGWRILRNSGYSTLVGWLGTAFGGEGFLSSALLSYGLYASIFCLYGFIASIFCTFGVPLV